MEEDDNSRKRLRRKVLDRWENEGGRLSEDSQKAPESVQAAKGDVKRTIRKSRTTTRREKTK